MHRRRVLEKAMVRLDGFSWVWPVLVLLPGLLIVLLGPWMIELVELLGP
jgi:hypothetical protein